MRMYRGSDNAIKIIRDKGNLSDLLQNSGEHSRDELTKAVMTCYSGEAYGDCNWPKTSGGWTTPEISTIYGDFRTQYENLVQLSLDSGFITHLPEFMEFLKTNNLDAQDYLAVRDKFKQSLGNKIVWRGMVLTEKEAEKIKTKGIESNFLKRTSDMPAVVENFEANVLSVYFDELVERHFHGENYHSPLVSVSSHKDMAMAVGRHFGRNLLSKNPKSLYLFKINIPEIDLIYYSDHAIKTPYKLQDLIKNGIHLHVSVNENESSYPWDKETESYLLHKVNPEEIIEISKPAVNKSSWNNKVSL